MSEQQLGKNNPQTFRISEDCVRQWLTLQQTKMTVLNTVKSDDRQNGRKFQQQAPKPPCPRQRQRRLLAHHDPGGSRWTQSPELRHRDPLENPWRAASVSGMGGQLSPGGDGVLKESDLLAEVCPRTRPSGLCWTPRWETGRKLWASSTGGFLNCHHQSV